MPRSPGWSSGRPAVATRPHVGRHPQSGYPPPGACRCQFIVGAGVAGRATDEDATVGQIANVPVPRVLGTAIHPCPFRRGELALETVQKPIQNLHLAFVEHVGGMNLPEAGLGLEGSEGMAGAFRRTGMVEASLRHPSSPFVDFDSPKNFARFARPPQIRRPGRIGHRFRHPSAVAGRPPIRPAAAPPVRPPRSHRAGAGREC